MTDDPPTPERSRATVTNAAVAKAEVTNAGLADAGLADAGLADADDRQLEIWAFGRQSDATDRERADSALRELARRAELARAANEAAAHPGADPGDGAGDGPGARPGDADAESSVEDPDLAARHRHRMLRTGQAGLIAALLAVGAGAVALTLPEPGPFAMFDRAPTSDELEWQERLESGLRSVITESPRVVELGDGLVAIVFRSAAVADGRSTAYDPYCIVVSGESVDLSRGIINAGCALPERMTSQGLTLPLGPIEGGEGFEVVTWGPQGGPRIEQVASPDGVGAAESVLDWMVSPTSQADAAPLIDDPEQLLLGPAIVPIFTPADDAPNVTTVAFVVQGGTEDAGPVFCVTSTLPDEGPTQVCAPLDTVRRDGLQYTVTAEGRAWQVSIGADGPQRSDTLRPAD
ncbi:hypothetical protein [Microcella sp.]|uniref:hypothetical protein n=1 Tax=Microcella sp. TaxID=1913979 RepID=UPI00391C44FC